MLCDPVAGPANGTDDRIKTESIAGTPWFINKLPAST
jgi:hypothetical protein